MVSIMLATLAGALMATSLLLYAVAVIALAVVPPVTLIIALGKLSADAHAKTVGDDRPRPIEAT